MRAGDDTSEHAVNVGTTLQAQCRRAGCRAIRITHSSACVPRHMPCTSPSRICESESVEMCLRKWVVIAGMIAAVSTVAPRTAAADWVFTPFVGWNFNGSADVETGGD